MALFSLIHSLLILPLLSLGIDDPPLTKVKVQSRIAEQVVLFPQEKLYVQTDKPYYVLGEKLWFRAHLVDGILHIPSRQSTYVYLELINPLDSVVQRVQVKQIDGAFSGSITLSETLDEGAYMLRAYTDNLRSLGEEYFYHRQIHLLSPFLNKAEDKDETIRASLNPSSFTNRLNTRDTKTLNTDKERSAALPSVSFYPEGGYLLTGVQCRVAFKALHSDGSPAKIKGRLIDSEGLDYGPIETLHAGMGSFELAAETGKRYFLINDDVGGDSKKFELPKSQVNMHSLQVDRVGKDLQVSVLQSSDKKTTSPLYLLLHTRGMVHYMSLWDNRYSTLLFDISDFPSGIVQILLLDENANPLSERLYFCRNDDEAKLSFSTDREIYPSRSLVKTAIDLTDKEGLPLSGSFSVSITSDLDLSPDSSQHILSSLLLNSELKGFIENPSFYFEEASLPLLDLLMLTHGWRRYDIPNVIKQRYSYPVHPSRSGMEIRGRVKINSRGKPSIGSKVSLFQWNSDYSNETRTDSTGSFVFDGFEFPDSLTFVVQAETIKGRNNLILDVDKEVFPSVLGDIFGRSNLNSISPENRNSLVDKANRQYEVEHGIRLRDVEITGRRPKNNESDSFYMPKEGTDVLNSEDLEKNSYINLSEIIRQFPFVRVVEDASLKQKVIIERMKNTIRPDDMNYAALIVDDMVLYDYDLDNVTEPSNIERIGVLKGAAATMLGGNGAGGAIVITTKKGLYKNNTPPVNYIKWITPLGFHTQVEFYSPQYDQADRRSRTTGDFRTTIYWNPNVKISSSGKAEFEFYTADTNTTYTAVIEGVADNGMLIHNKSQIITR